MKLVAFYIFVVLCIVCGFAFAAHRDGDTITLTEDEVKLCDELGCVVITKPALMRLISACGTKT